MQLVSLGGEEGEEVAGPQSLESAGHVFSPTTPAPVHAPAPTRPHQRQQQELREKLTLVVTTSPVASNPDTSMLHEVLATQLPVFEEVVLEGLHENVEHWEQVKASNEVGGGGGGGGGGE